MTTTDRDLVAAIRAELASIDPSRPCDRAAESAGLGPGLSTREAAVARLAVRLGRGRDGGRDATRAGGRTGGRAGGRASKHVRMLDDDAWAPAGDLAGGLRETRTGDRAAPSDVSSVPGRDRAPLEVPVDGFDWNAAAEHCRWAFLRGRFLARGSLSLSSSRAHLEFVVRAEEAPLLAARLAGLDLPASWRIRRGRGVVTWKSAETIALFLRRIGAGASLLEYESRRVSRALRGDLNRVINAESANLQRAVAAAGRQLAAIEELEADGRLSEQPYVVRLVADARRETPEATLTELAERLELRRSAVQRALERLERLVLHPDEETGHRAERPARRGASARQKAPEALASFGP